MKSSFELAMERLNKNAPTVKLTTKQKAEIAELESKHKAKVATLELSAREDIAKATATGNAEKAAEIQALLVAERNKLLARLEDQKAAVRRG